MFREISAWHLLLILLAFVILFGYKRLPDATRSLGRSMRIFKSEIKGLHDDEPKQVDPVQPVAHTEVRTEAAPAPAPAEPVHSTEPRTESDRA